MSSSCSSRCRIQSACSAGLLLVLTVAAPWRRGLAQQQDEALVGQLARVLAAADARAFDAALFRETLHHPDAVVRRQAALAIGRIGDPAGTDLLVDALADSGVAVRAAAAFGLGLLKDVRAVAARGLSRALIDSARLDPQVVVGRLRPLLGDRDPQVRINALRALATFHDSAVARLAVPLAGDADANVAVQAETTLGVLGGRAAVEVLGARLASAVFALRRQALIALAQADSGAGVAAAAALPRDADWRWRSVAAEVFGAARDRSRLEAQLTDGDGRVVAQALQTLARLVPEADTTLGPRARQLLAHPDPAVRSIAADLLARHPATADVDRLIQAYTRAAGDPFDDARLSAVAALGAIARAGAEGRLAVAGRFLATAPRADDYLVRRLAAERLPDAAERWGPAVPIATGRGSEAYRDAVRRYLLAALRGQPPRVTIETDRGTMVAELYATEAPLTVAAFLDLVERRYFDGSRWHRVVPNFVAQDGDPRGDGWGGPGFVLRDELNPVRYETGTMGMALSGPDTGGSQFFITHSPQPHLDGTYTVFGPVVAGVTVLRAITRAGVMRSVARTRETS